VTGLPGEEVLARHPVRTAELPRRQVAPADQLVQVALAEASPDGDFPDLQVLGRNLDWRRWGRKPSEQPGVGCGELADDLRNLGRRDGLRVELLEPVDVGEDPAQLARVKIHVARLERDAREHGDMADFVLGKWHDEA